MNHSANRPAFYLNVTQLALALCCLLAFSTNAIGFQADKDDGPKTEQKEADQDKADQEESGDEESDQKKSDQEETKQKKDDKKEDKADEDAIPDFLKIGGEAPALEIDYWPTDNNGLLPPVKKFESGKTYVLNFFQPDNPYSVSHLKSMVELQSKYSGKPVQVVCICSSDREKSDEFLDSEVKGDDEDAETYIDLLNPVSTAVDSKQTATVSYMARSGILTAWTFIIGPTGKIEWLGRPTDVDKPLAQIVKGKWDRKAFAKKIEPEQTKLYRRLKVDRLFAQWMVEATQGKRINATELLEQFAEGAKDPANKEFRIRIESTRMALMLRALAAGADIDGLEEDLPAAMQGVTELSEDDSNLELNNSAWQVYEMYEAGIIEKDSELMEAAQEMAEKALKFSPKSGAVNDTVAHFVYLLDGDLDRAIKLQKFAIKNSEDTQVEELEKFLKFLKKEKATGEKKSLQNQGGDDKGGDSDF